MLQEVPLVISAAVLLCYSLDFIETDVSKYMYPVFGFSLYILLRMYSVSRRMYVSKWSLVLYITLIAVSAVELVDNVFPLAIRTVETQQILVIILIAGIISSFITFLYGKFQDIP